MEDKHKLSSRLDLYNTFPVAENDVVNLNSLNPKSDARDARRKTETEARATNPSQRAIALAAIPYQ